ncbi:MAG: hypothetical protein HYW49_06355 [Deltaproteobacteria bacterium]|nr:hypothetical protein [Deltaproteobacteria bacterium]
MKNNRTKFPARSLFFSIAWLFLFASSLALGRVSYPIRKETAGLTEYLFLLKTKKISSSSEFFALYGEGPSKAKSPVGRRYLYSFKWGWIDMRHFSAAAYYGEKWYLSGHGILTFGEFKEWRQSQNNSGNSAYNYEDFVSNLLGVFFGTRYEYDKKKSYVANLGAYLEKLGFVDDPLTIAPNADQVPEDYSLKPGEIEKSHDYNPRHAKFNEKDLNALDRKIMKYRKKYLSRSIVD